MAKALQVTARKRVPNCQHPEANTCQAQCLRTSDQLSQRSLHDVLGSCCWLASNNIHESMTSCNYCSKICSPHHSSACTGKDVAGLSSTSSSCLIQLPLCSFQEEARLKADSPTHWISTDVDSEICAKAGGLAGLDPGPEIRRVIQASPTPSQRFWGGQGGLRRLLGSAQAVLGPKCRVTWIWGRNGRCMGV